MGGVAFFYVFTLLQRCSFFQCVWLWQQVLFCQIPLIFCFRKSFQFFCSFFVFFQYNSIGLSQVQLWPKNVVHYKVETGFNFSTIYILILGGRDQGVVLRARPRAKGGLVNNKKEKKCPRLVCFITLDFFCFSSPWLQGQKTFKTSNIVKNSFCYLNFQKKLLIKI